MRGLPGVHDEGGCEPTAIHGLPKQLKIVFRKLWRSHALGDSDERESTAARAGENTTLSPYPSEPPFGEN